MPRYIDADLMAQEESDAYMSAQIKVTDCATKMVNEVVHKKIQMLLADAPTADVVEASEHKRLRNKLSREERRVRKLKKRIEELEKGAQE